MAEKETLEEARARNQRAFMRLRKKLAETHSGQWIGLVEGQVAVIAPDEDTLWARLDQIERDPGRRMVFRAGDPYPHAKVPLPILPLRW